MPTSVSAEGILTPNHIDLILISQKVFRLFLDKTKLHIRMNILSSFTRVFQWNWLKIGRYVPYYLLRKRVSGFA